MASFSAASAVATGGSAVITVPAGQRWRVRTAELEMNASSVVVNRVVALEVTVNGILTCFVSSSYQQHANENVFYAFGPGLTTDSALIDGDIRTGFPEVSLGPGDTIEAVVAGMDAADVSTFGVNFEAELV